MLIAEDLALLLLDDERGSFALDAVHRGPVLAGAVLVELVLAGRVGPEEGRESRPRARLVVVDGSPTGDALLDAALATAGEHVPVRPERLLRPLAKGLERALLERLLSAGVVSAERSRLLRLFPVVRHPAADPGPERAVRTRLTSALRSGSAADPRTAALVALLSVSGALAKVQDPEEVGLTRRELVAVGKQVAADDRVAAGVKRALDGINAAVMGSIAVSAGSAAAAGS